MKYNYIKWLIDKRKLDPKNNKMDRWLCNLLEKSDREFYRKYPFFLEGRRRVHMREWKQKESRRRHVAPAVAGVNNLCFSAKFSPPVPKGTG